MFCCVLSVPLPTKHRTLSWLCVAMGFIFTIAGLYDLAFERQPATWITYILACFLGISLTGSQLIPDAILGDIIDYDELGTGRRNEAMYTVSDLFCSVQAMYTVRGAERTAVPVV